MTEVLARRSPSLAVAQSEPGMIFFTTPRIARQFDTTRLSTGGIVVGKLFAHGGSDVGQSAPCTGFSGEQANAIVESGGAALARLVWGRYVALVRGQDHKWYVLRDPGGALRCFVGRIGEFLCVFSDLRDFLAVYDGPLSLSWDHLRAFVVDVGMASCSTGYREISQLLPGQRMRLDAHLSTDFYWSPRQFCVTDVVESRGEAESLLRQSVLTSVQAWGSCYDSVLLQLSGGLDSAVVLACLAELRPTLRTVNVNHYPTNPEGDERRYAREVAHHFACDLVEIELPSSRVSFRQVNLAENIPSPMFCGWWSPADDVQATILKKNGAEAIFSGLGGDQVFVNRFDARMAMEFARRHPLSLRLWDVAMDAAFAAKASVWSVLAHVIRDAMGRRRHDPYAKRTAPPFLRESAQGAEHFRHPWAGDDTLPESKNEQALGLIDCHRFHLGGCSYAEQVNPLISQPIFEASLRIPTYVLSHDGVSRALIRKCFESRLPRSIYHRMSKGDTTGYHYNRLLSDLGYVRELTLGGRFAQEGLIDTAYLESMLDADHLMMHERWWSAINGLIIAETWLRHAQTRGGFQQEPAFNVA